MEDHQINCPRCKNIIEQAIKKIKNISLRINNDEMGVCDHCRSIRRSHQARRISETVKKYGIIDEQKQDNKQHMSFWANKVQHLINDTLVQKSIIKKCINSDLDINKLCHVSSKFVHKPQISELIKPHSTTHAHIKQADVKKEKRIFLHESNTHILDDSISYDVFLKSGENLMIDKNIEFSILSHNKYPHKETNPQLCDSLDQSYADYYHQNALLYELGSCSDRSDASASEFSHPIFTSCLRKYNSQESLSKRFEDEKEEYLVEDFHYAFPEINADEKPKIFKSSYKLLKETTDFLKEKEIKRNDEKQKIREQNENNKISCEERKRPVKEENVRIDNEKSPNMAKFAEVKLRFSEETPELTEEILKKDNKIKASRTITHQDEIKSFKTKKKDATKYYIDINKYDAKQERHEKLKQIQKKKDIFIMDNKEQKRLENEQLQKDKKQKPFVKENEAKTGKVKEEKKSLYTTIKSKELNEHDEEKKDKNHDSVTTKKSKKWELNEDKVKKEQESLVPQKPREMKIKKRNKTLQDGSLAISGIELHNIKMVKKETGARDSELVKRKNEAQKLESLELIKKVNKKSTNSKDINTVTQDIIKPGVPEALKTKLNLSANPLKMLLSKQVKQKDEHVKVMKIRKEYEKCMEPEAEQRLKEDLNQKAKPKPEASEIVNEVAKRKIEGHSDIVSKELSLKNIKTERKSLDDFILNLVKIKRLPSTPLKKLKTSAREILKNITPMDVIRHKSHVGVLKTECVLCGDSDLELDLDSLLGNKTKMNMKLMDFIIGEKVVKHKPQQIDDAGIQKTPPLLFHSTLSAEAILTEPLTKTKVVGSDAIEIQTKTNQFSKGSKTHQSGAPSETSKGIIRYSLSDRTFIEKGWTMLPTEKVVRKMNVYRMRPSHPEFDWFKHNKNKRMIQYDSGEKLAEFNDNGRGRLYYRNGRLALDYYDAEEINAQQRFVIYSSGEPDERGRSRPVTVLATFDYLGNGIVFDHAGKIRLKYNQTEGVVLDRSIGPVSHWKWHTLNDPPVLQQVMIDTQMAHKDPTIIKLSSSGENKPRTDNEDMLAIEFDNFIKEKSKKLTQKFRPFQIKMKALKINEFFSLRVLDQATVYLLFRDGSTNIKMNIGMVLDHHEIIDTDTAEVGAVSSAVEHLPARTDSIAELQRNVAQAQRFNRLRTKRECRIRPPKHCCSADQLVAAASQPLRPSLHIAASSSAIAVNGCYCSYRKPDANNIYYDSRLI